jgi:hypothetical protein
MLCGPSREFPPAETTQVVLCSNAGKRCSVRAVMRGTRQNIAFSLAILTVLTFPADA